MATRQKWAAWALCVTSIVASQTSARAETITLPEAIKRAEQTNPELAVGEADVEVAAGELTGARRTPYNPELGVALGPAFGGGDTFLDYEVTLSQSLELGGKRGKRVSGAKARKSGADLRLRWTRAMTHLKVRRAFFLALIARERLTAAREGEAVATELSTASVDRLKLGAGTQLEVNVASAALGRARAERTLAERRYLEARTELAHAIGTQASVDIEPDGELPTLKASVLSEDALVQRALADRPDLAAAQQDRLAAQADLSLAYAARNPDAALGVSYGHSGLEDSDTILFGVTIALPVWNRNQGGREEARARVKRTEILEKSGKQEAERHARAAFRGYRLALEAVEGFDRDVVGRLGENLSLARDSFASGKIGLLEFNIVRRELVETRFAYLDSLAELVEARYALELSAGGDIE